MRLSHGRGFTLVEVLISTSILAVVAAATYLLLDTGLRARSTTHEESRGIGAFSRTLLLIRGDIARSERILFLGADSLAMQSPTGERISYATRRSIAGAEIFRSVDEGSGWIERPLRAVATLYDQPDQQAYMSFTDGVGGTVTVELMSDGHRIRFAAGSWMSP